MTTMKAMGFLVTVLLAAPAYCHRDQEALSSSSSKARAGSRTARAHVARHQNSADGSSRNAALEKMVDKLDAVCKKSQDDYTGDDSGIEALRSCVHALEAYAIRVREHEKESFKAHGRYRRAFIQTYAILKSVLNENKQLHRFKETFKQNHTHAAEYLGGELDKIRNVIGKDWLSDTEAQGPAGEQGPAGALLQDGDKENESPEADDEHDEKDQDKASAQVESSSLELKGDGHLQHSRHSRPR